MEWEDGGSPLSGLGRVPAPVPELFGAGQAGRHPCAVRCLQPTYLMAHALQLLGPQRYFVARRHRVRTARPARRGGLHADPEAGRAGRAGRGNERCPTCHNIPQVEATEQEIGWPLACSVLGPPWPEPQGPEGQPAGRAGQHDGAQPGCSRCPLPRAPPVPRLRRPSVGTVRDWPGGCRNPRGVRWSMRACYLCASRSRPVSPGAALLDCGTGLGS